MSDKESFCDLCGLEIEVSGFDLLTVEGPKAFCCEGCKGIFLMLHEDIIVDEDDSLQRT